MNELLLLQCVMTNYIWINLFLSVVCCDNKWLLSLLLSLKLLFSYLGISLIIRLVRAFILYSQNSNQDQFHYNSNNESTKYTAYYLNNPAKLNTWITGLHHFELVRGCKATTELHHCELARPPRQWARSKLDLLKFIAGWVQIFKWTISLPLLYLLLVILWLWFDQFLNEFLNNNKILLPLLTNRISISTMRDKHK